MFPLNNHTKAHYHYSRELWDAYLSDRTARYPSLFFSQLPRDLFTEVQYFVIVPIMDYRSKQFHNFAASQFCSS
jgi:hypothetical protein